MLVFLQIHVSGQCNGVNANVQCTGIAAKGETLLASLKGAKADNQIAVLEGGVIDGEALAAPFRVLCRKMSNERPGERRLLTDPADNPRHIC
jgi:hypothetical protein